MRKVIYYAAVSLDGYIARPDGSVDWLYDAEDYDTESFFDSIDTIIQGRKTYEQALTFGEWPFGNKESFIFSKTKAGEVSQHGLFVDQDIPVFINQMRSVPGKDIWLIGGGELAGAFLDACCIDTLWLFVHPVLLGEGIPLFQLPHNETQLTLDYAIARSRGVVEMKYTRTTGNP